MQQSITPEFIKSCLLSMNDYKNTLIIKKAVQENQEKTFNTICETIKDVLITDKYIPISKLFAMRLCKDLIDIFNMQFVQKFELQTLESLKYYAEFGDPNNDSNRGTNLFGENMEKDIKQIGVSLVRLASECIHAWAQFFPTKLQGGPTNYIKLYLEIKDKGYTFPNWTYYKEDFVKSKKSDQFPRVVDLLLSSSIQEMKGSFLESRRLQQPIKVENAQIQSNINISQTPNSYTPGNQGNPRVNCVQKSKLVIDSCRKLIAKVGDICSRTLNCEPQMFQLQKDEAFAKNEEMDILVNELIDYEEEDLAAEVMIEMDQLQALQQDINDLNKELSNQEFRKKYIKNNRDYALEEFQQIKQREIEQQEFQRQEALKRYQIEQENAKKQDIILQELEAKQKKEQEQREKQIQQQLIEQQKEDEKKRKEQEKLEQLDREQKRLIQEQNEKIQIQEEEERKKKEYEIQKKKEEQELLEKLRKEEELRLLKQKYDQELKEKEQKEKEEQERKFKQQQEEQRRRDLEQQQKIIDLQGSYQQNQISLSDLQKAQELVGTSNIKISSSQSEYPLDKSQIQNKFRKPISQSSQGRNLQPQNQKIKGDFSGAPDMIKENKSQINQFEKNQLEILQQQVENLQRDKQQIQKQLEEALNRNKQLQEDMYSLNGGENRIQEDLKNLQKKFDQLQQEKNFIQNQLTVSKQQFDEYKRNAEKMQKQNEEYKLNTEKMKQQLRENNDLEENNFKIEKQQLFQEKQALKQQLDLLKAQQTNNVEYQDKVTLNEHLIQQLRREIENLKQEKLIIQKRLQEDNDQNKLLLNEQSNFSEALNKQLNIYKAQIEKSSQDYLNIQEYQKKQSEQLLLQVSEARKESMNSKQQINIIQLQLSDKEAENRQLQQIYQVTLKENQQLKKNLEISQQQIDQFLQNNMDNRGSALLQQKLQQKLDEIDRLKEDHIISLKEKDDYYRQRIEDITQEKQKLQKDLSEQQQEYKNNIAAMEAIQKQVQQKFRMSSKHTSKSQMSELESIQINSPKKQFEFSDAKMNIYQQQQTLICPIAGFKHFPASRQFYHEQVIQKQKNFDPESLELIYPYQSPEEYFDKKPQKTRKGRIIQQTQNFDEISHLNKQNIILFKQRCLGTQGILFEEHGVQFGLLYQTQVQKNKSYFTYGLYIKNFQDMKYNFTIQFMEIEKFQQFWADPIEFSKTLEDNSNDLIEIVIGSNKIPQQILTLQISYSDIHPFQIYIPNHICQQIVYREIKVNEFQSQWKQQISNQIRTPLLNLNKEVIKDIDNFKKQISKIIILNINKINDFELGIDEIKLGGLGFYSDISFLIKFEILPNDKICIYLTFESIYNSQRQILEKILNGYALILGGDDKVE